MPTDCPFTHGLRDFWITLYYIHTHTHTHTHTHMHIYMYTEHEGRVVNAPWATCIHKYLRFSLPVSRRRCSNCRNTSGDHDNVARITLQHYQLDYYRHRVLRACCSIRRVCDLLCTVSLEYNAVCVSSWQTLLRCVLSHLTAACLQN
jgi:hypothetical protein